jgi:transposase
MKHPLPARRAGVPDDLRQTPAADEREGLAFGRPCPVSDLFGAEGRRLLERLEVPEPWRSNVTASVALIDDLERQISDLNRRLKESHADHPYIPLLRTVPGIGWVLAFTIAAEIGTIERFSSPAKLTG